MKTLVKDLGPLDRWVQRVATATLLVLAASLLVVGVALYV